MTTENSQCNYELTFMQCKFCLLISHVFHFHILFFQIGKLLAGAILLSHGSSSIMSATGSSKTPMKRGENIHWYWFCLCSLCSMSIRAVSIYFIILGLKWFISLYGGSPGLRHQFELPKFLLLLKIAKRCYPKNLIENLLISPCCAELRWRNIMDNIFYFSCM